MYVERTNYYAKPGKAEAVLDIRRRASAIRVQLGLSAGTIFTRSGATSQGADVTWENTYETIADYERDMAARAASPDFAAVRDAVGSVIERFERHVMQRDDTPGAAGPAAGAGAAPLAGAAVVPRQVQFKSGAHELTGYLYVPDGPGPHPCIITSHGSSIEQGTWDASRPGTAALLLSWGYASFLPHRAGYGNSPGVGWLKDVSAGFGTEDYDKQLARRMDRESDDVIAALDWLSGQNEIATNRIALMGSSFGGTVTLLAAAKTARICCAVEFAGAAMNWEKTPGLRKVMKAAARRLAKPIFFLQAANDFSTGPTVALGKIVEQEGPQGSLAKVYPAFGVTSYEGHLFEKAGALVWGPEVRAFLDRYV